MEHPELSEALDELEEVALKVRRRIVEWAHLSRLGSLMRQGEILTNIGTLDKALDTYATRFPLVSSIELNGQQHRVDLLCQQDQEDIRRMLRALVRSAGDLLTAARIWNDVPGLMQIIQEELADQQAGTDEQVALRKSLNTLYIKTGVLPPLTNLNGQVTKLTEPSAAEGGTADIYRGQWVGSEIFMLKPIERIKNESAVKRLRREVEAWRQLQHIHVLQVYGICYIDPTLFLVSRWTDGGNLLLYTRTHPQCDRVRFLSQITQGLAYLHTLKPRIIHGDLRAANILVSVHGEALLIGFGTTTILAEEEGADVAFTSLINAGSSRWMAPELFGVDISALTFSPSSDVWSFGMLCLELFTEKPPFWDCSTDVHIVARLSRHSLPPRPEYPEIYELGLSDDLWDLVQGCWAWSPDLRPQTPMLATKMHKLHIGYMARFGVAEESTQSPDIDHSTRFFRSSIRETGPTTDTILGQPSSTGTPYFYLTAGPSKSSLYSTDMPGSPSLRMMSLCSSSSAYVPDARINYNTEGRVLTGNLIGLVDRLLVSTDSNQMDEEFRDCFLTVYREFVQTADLYALLIERYNMQAFGYASGQKRVEIKKNMTNILAKWLEVQELAPGDHGLLQEVESLVNADSNNKTLDTEQNELQATIKERLHKLEQPPPFDPVDSRQCAKLLDMDPATIAKQLMRMENDLFQKILPSDYVTWKNHYKISDWCQSVILFAKSDEVESRALIVMFFVRIAEECLRMRSLSTAHAIAAGLATDFILGLSYTWRLVDERTKISLKQISEIVTDVDKCKSALGRDSQALPILTAHLRELRRAHGGLDPYVVQDAEQLINFQNFEALWGSIKAITKYKVQVSKDPTASAYLDYAFSQLKDGEALQHLFKTRREELKREEGCFYEARRLELAAVDFTPPKAKAE